MEVIEVAIIDPKVKRILNDLADLDLIQLSKPYKLLALQKKNISAGRIQIKKGQSKEHSKVMRDLEKWLKEK